jgi:hypothetical protein
MHKEVMRAIAGIDVFPVISLVLFVIVFTVAVIRALRLDRRLVEQLSLLPLDDEAATPGTPAQHSALRTRHFSEVSRGDQA